MLNDEWAASDHRSTPSLHSAFIIHHSAFLISHCGGQSVAAAAGPAVPGGGTIGTPYRTPSGRSRSESDWLTGSSGGTAFSWM
jgi:hypothetical protein